MTSTKTVSIWVANTGWDIPTLQQATTPSYSEDGEYLGSDFTRAFALDFIDDDLMEADKVEITSSLPDAIEGFSYDSEISNSINRNPTKIPPTDTVILIYELQYSGTPTRSLIKGKEFIYSGCFEYRE
ncbi:immunity 22 family protein [Pseudomonas chlororaphis]|uniref:immunity 22 family protein n=1 Tax=Pseudomonas chlororaphis TaxID=587753 RepID=UPI002365440B|nr:immunity 22 family protein [Pseudomonas chlororaphis]WDH20651.1 immunity 22 family protein [Pseudomonas chlororaphis]